MGGIFVNQELIVQMLNYVLPKNIMIYVKEHPVTSNALRSISFYKSLLISPRIFFVRRNFSSHQLIQHSMAVATATGTAGWEALTMQKPILMFGYDFYKFARGVFPINSIDSCKSAIDKIVRIKYTPSLAELYTFYKAMEDVFVDGYVNVDLMKPFSSLSDNTNIQNTSSAMAHALIQALNQKKDSAAKHTHAA